MNKRQIYYVILQIPTELIEEGLKIAPKEDVKKKGFILSTDDKNPSDKPILIEQEDIDRFAKQGQKGTTLYLPIQKTNRWTKLSKEYIIRIDFYHSPISEEVSK